MFDEKLISKLKERYPVHPLIFHRSMEKAKTAGDLFDILDTMPNKFPLIWNEKERRWLNTNDLYQIGGFLK